MARLLNLQITDKDFRKVLARSFQSGHINFLIGSGASLPAIPAAGQVEQQIGDLFNQGQDAEARLRLYEFLTTIQEPCNRLISDALDENCDRSVTQYVNFLQTIEIILTDRRTTLLPKQATLFSTNYDLFVEKASSKFPALRLNDGFSRIPSLNNRMVFSPQNFFNATYNTGNLYNYRVEIPCINLVKLHGSVSWNRDEDEFVFKVAQRNLLGADRTPEQIKAFIEEYAVVLPQAAKFRTTLMDRTYYELLRIYANQLDRENTLLIAIGFSFGDEHILDITKRALRNPTLRLMAFAYDSAAKDSLSEKFAGHNNVEIITPAEGETADFSKINEALRSFLPTKTGAE